MSITTLGIVVGSAVCICTGLAVMANENIPDRYVFRGFWGGYTLAMGSLVWALLGPVIA